MERVVFVRRIVLLLLCVPRSAFRKPLRGWVGDGAGNEEKRRIGVRKICPAKGKGRHRGR